MNIYLVVWYDGVGAHRYVITAEDTTFATNAVAAIHTTGTLQSITLLGAAATGP